MQANFESLKELAKKLNIIVEKEKKGYYLYCNSNGVSCTCKNLAQVFDEITSFLVHNKDFGLFVTYHEPKHHEAYFPGRTWFAETEIGLAQQMPQNFREYSHKVYWANNKEYKLLVLWERALDRT